MNGKSGVSAAALLLAGAAAAFAPAHADEQAGPTVGVTASPAVVSEGNQLTFSFTLSEPAPAEGLPVRLALYRDTDPAPGDIAYNVDGSNNIAGFELIRDDAGLITDAMVTIAGGATEATMLSNINADDVDEPEERVVFALAVSTGYEIDEEHDRAAFVISDYPVVAVTSEPESVPEGSQLTMTFTLSKPAPEGGLPVRLALLRDTDPLPGDIAYNVEGGSNIDGFALIRDSRDLITDAIVTLSAGATEAVMLSDIHADDVSEGPESVTFGLAVSASYAIDPDHNTVSFTIAE